MMKNKSQQLLQPIVDIFWQKASFALLASLIILLVGIGLIRSGGVDVTKIDITYLITALISSWIGIVLWTSLLIKRESQSNWLSLLVVLVVYMLFGLCAILLGAEVFRFVGTKSDSLYLSTSSFLGNGNFNECQFDGQIINPYTCHTYRIANMILSIAGHIHGAISLAILMLWLKIK